MALVRSPSLNLLSETERHPELMTALLREAGVVVVTPAPSRRGPTSPSRAGER